MFALRGWGMWPAHVARTCGPHGPDMWPGQPGRVARTCSPDGPDMWPRTIWTWPGQPGHVARTARTCGPDGPEHVARWQESGLSGLSGLGVAWQVQGGRVWMADV